MLTTFPSERAPPELAPPEFAPPGSVAWQTLLLYAPRKEKASQASDYVLISMREVATHNWSTPEPRM
jgi:hypothetical protein